MGSPAISCAMALKEWATVLEAMAKGEQIVLIRKGGLIEPGSGFDLVADQFVFYPTFEHQAVNYLRSPYQAYFEQASQQRAAEGQVRFELFGQAVFSVKSHEPKIVEHLKDFHIYNDDFVSQRLKWQPDQPLLIAVIRAFRLSLPSIIPVAAQYAGCKSWVELESPVTLEGLQPVLSDADFAQRFNQVKALLDAVS